MCIPLSVFALMKMQKWGGHAKPPLLHLLSVVWEFYWITHKTQSNNMRSLLAWTIDFTLLAGQAVNIWI